MIKSLYTIGKVLKDKYPEYFEPWGNPFRDDEENAKVIVANIKNGKLEDNLEEENFRSEMIHKYLFRKLSGSRGTYLVPTLNFYNKITNKDFDRLKRVLENNIQFILKYLKSDKASITELYKELRKKLRILNLNRDNKYLFTIKIDDKYLGEIEEFRNIIIEKAYSKYFKTETYTSKGENKICSVTYQQSDAVWGKVDTLGFTVNDSTFVRNGFDQNHSYKMFPVSPDAAIILEGTRRIIIEKFKGSQYYLSGLNYFILPHFVNVNDSLMKEILDIFMGKVSIDLQDKSKTLFENEVLLNEIISEEKLNKNNIYYDIFFYQINKVQFLIKLHLNDVLPSRLRKIFEIKNRLENFYKNLTRVIIHKNKKTEKVIDSFITFNTFKKYYSTVVKKKSIFHPTFFKIIESVFYGNYLNEIEILNSFLIQIISDFKNRNSDKYAFSQTVKESFVLYQFLFQLNLFKNKKYMEIQDDQKISLNIEEFINQHPDFFDSDYKKAIFMLGCLTKKLLFVQYSNLKNTPFEKELNNLSIDDKILNKILTKIKAKLINYRTSFPKLEQEIAKLIVNKENISRETISYIFTLGLIMENEFNEERKRQNKDKKTELESKENNKE